jgi:16S rRNA (cytosine1402-N4)-methyltransferase
MQNQHIPVLLDPILEFLQNQGYKNRKNIFDGTFGGGSYSKAFLDLNFKVFACDRDQQVIDLAQTNFKESFKNQNLHLSQASYNHFIDSFEDGFFEAIVLDLGFSSNQLAFSERGFSYQNISEPLDLRYDISLGKPCFLKLKQLKTAFDLQKIIYNYSGEQLSKRLATGIFEQYILSDKNDLSVGEVVEILVSSIPVKLRYKQKGILSRVWQSLRIWTNDELLELEEFLPKASQKLSQNGILIIVSFHSLEDKIVTKFMRNLSRPEEIDTYGNKIQKYKLLTPKVVVPTELEIQQNPRSRSGLLRVMQKID